MYQSKSYSIVPAPVLLLPFVFIQQSHACSTARDSRLQYSSIYCTEREAKDKQLKGSSCPETQTAVMY